MPKRVYTRAHATVRFMAPDLDPLQITMSLRLPPDIQYRRGEPRLKWAEKGVINDYGDHRFGLWSMSSKDRVDSPCLQTHLDWLLGKLESRADAIRSLTIDGLEIDFFCYSLGNSPFAPSLPRSIVERAGNLAIKIKIDHYNSANDEVVA